MELGDPKIFAKRSHSSDIGLDRIKFHMDFNPTSSHSPTSQTSCIIEETTTKISLLILSFKSDSIINTTTARIIFIAGDEYHAFCIL